MYKVKDLIKELNRLDKEAIVVLSRDEEGNGFSPLAQIDPYQVYNDENREVGYDNLDEALINVGYKEEDLITGEKCLILYPRD